MSKKALMAATLDFYSLVFFGFIVITLLILFKMSDSGFDNEITAKFESGEADLNLRSMLRSPAEYQGHKVSLAELVSMYACGKDITYDDELYKLINSTVKGLSDRLGIRVRFFTVLADTSEVNEGFEYNFGEPCHLVEGNALIGSFMPPRAQAVAYPPIQYQPVGARIKYCKNE